MIVGGKVEDITGKRAKDETVKGLSISIEVDNVKFKGEDVEIKYTYKAKYGGGSEIKIKGMIMAKEDKKTAENMKKEWEKKKKLPNDYAENLINVINFAGSSNGTLLARVLNIPAPLTPSRIRLGGEGGASS